MTTSDREPQYLGTHRGVSRVQIGWTTLYFTGDGYTHAIGNLYGTHEQPAREDIAAARKAIPVKPRPPTLAHAPSEERKPARPQEKVAKPVAKPSASAKQPPAPAVAAQAKAVPKPRAERKPKAKKTATSATKAPISTMTELMGSVTEAGPSIKAKPIGSMAELAAQLG
jgi:hypothetical protein